MPSTPLNLLPPPSTIQVADATIVRITEGGRVPRFRVPDPSLNPRRLMMSWSVTNAAVGDWIRRHYTDHHDSVFQFTVPRTLEVVYVMWASPPQIQWASSTTAATIIAELDEVLAHE